MTAATSFVRRDGTRLLGPDGSPQHFKGVGLGNWLLAEGYMWSFFAGANSPRLIEAMVSDLIGEQKAAEFWAGFRRTVVAKADIDLIAEWGFDHVRLPMNSRCLISDDGELLEDGFAPIDDCITWSKQAGLLVLLDLHGAPGGQTGANIDDSANNFPELFTDPQARANCIALWKELARRYADEPTVMGYDLLNEPLRDEFGEQFGQDLVDLYKDLTAAIREVDSNHLIMYEGTHWSTNFSIFTERWDENSCLQFHKYWSPPVVDSIQQYRDIARDLDLPLYMGESGENSPGWLRTSFGMYDDLGISWNFWPWKKLNNPSSPIDAPAPQGWDEMVAFAESKSSTPPADAERLLFEFVEAQKLGNCQRHEEIIDALMQRPHGWVPAIAADIRPTANSEAKTHEQEYRANEGYRFELLGAEAGAYVFAPDPRERARGGSYLLHLSAGDEVSFSFNGPEPAEIACAGQGVEHIDIRVSSTVSGCVINVISAGDVVLEGLNLA